jgi:hypothetical protein
MDAESRLAEAPLRQPRQFSVRELLVLTFATSLILAIGVSSRGSRYFSAFSSFWALTSLAPLAVILAVGRLYLASPRMLVVVSIMLYAASLCVPAVEMHFWNAAVLWGFHVWYSCMVFVPFALFGLFTNSLSDDDRFLGLASLMGCTANLAYIIGIILFFVGIKSAKVVNLCRRLSLLSASFAATVVVPIALTADLLDIYPGYGLWIASFLALVIATRRMRPNPELWLPIA